MSRLRRLTSRWVAKSASADFAMTLPWRDAPLGITTRRLVAQLHRVGLCLRQWRVDPGLGEVGDGDDGRSRGHHFALPCRSDVHLAGDRRDNLGVSQLNLRLVQQRLCILHLAVRCGHRFVCGLAWAVLACATLRAAAAAVTFCLAVSTAAFAASREVPASSRD